MNDKVKILTQINWQYLVRFGILLGVAVGVPMIGHSQWITGPIVNATLIAAVFVVGIRGALLIGMLPSVIALGGGLLPAPLAPMVPFIIIGNAILILLIDWSRRIDIRNNYWFGLLVGAGLKYLFLFLSSGVVVRLLLQQSLATKVAQMMSWPQFVTAVVGGVVAWGILKVIRNKD